MEEKKENIIQNQPDKAISQPEEEKAKPVEVQPVAKEQVQPAQAETPTQPVKQKKASLLIEKFKTSWQKLNPLTKKIFLFGGIFLAVLIVIAIAFSIYMAVKNNKSEVSTTPTPVASPTPETEIITNPSRYATDSAVLSIGERLKEIEKELNETKINDLKLSPPNLNWDINFDD